MSNASIFNRSRDPFLTFDGWQGRANATRERNRQRRIDQAARLVRQGFSIRRLADALNVSYMTALTYRHIVLKETGTLYCACGQQMGHRGWCKFRIAVSPERQAYLDRCARQSSQRREIIAARVRERKEDSAWWWLIKQLTPHPIHERRTRKLRQRLAPLATCYPYIREGEEIELLLLVNEAVPKTIPHEVRADVCQELLLSILTGELTRETFIDHIGAYTREAYKQLGDKYKEISLDAPLYRDGQTYTLLDTLAAPEIPEDEIYSTKHVYVRGGMPYAGALADATSVKDLAERLADHWEADRLLGHESRKSRVGIHIAERESDNREVQIQVAGVGRMKMSSYIRHSGHTFQLRNYKTKARDEIMFSIREYQERRAEEEKSTLAEVSGDQP